MLELLPCATRQNVPGSSLMVLEGDTCGADLNLTHGLELNQADSQNEAESPQLTRRPMREEEKCGEPLDWWRGLLHSRVVAET